MRVKKPQTAVCHVAVDQLMTLFQLTVRRRPNFSIGSHLFKVLSELLGRKNLDPLGPPRSADRPIVKSSPMSAGDSPMTVRCITLTCHRHRMLHVFGQGHCFCCGHAHRPGEAARCQSSHSTDERIKLAGNFDAKRPNWFNCGRRIKSIWQWHRVVMQSRPSRPFKRRHWPDRFVENGRENSTWTTADCQTLVLLFPAPVAPPSVQTPKLVMTFGCRHWLPSTSQFST